MNTEESEGRDYTVCGLIVMVNPNQFSDVLGRLHAMDNVDVHDASSDGRIVVTLEEFSATPSIAGRIESIGDIDGVIDLSLAYTHTEPVDTRIDSHPETVM